MATDPYKELLKDRRVVDEIERYRCLESETAGRDIGFEQAAQEWCLLFAKIWTHYHKPDMSSKTSVHNRFVNKRFIFPDISE